ncbi:MAG: hypothetical protein JWM11_7792 [Planctomycetaceae bacterium]|nr:hypothetical protein [Planctomycetaceae bacterium]
MIGVKSPEIPLLTCGFDGDFQSLSHFALGKLDRQNAVGTVGPMALANLGMAFASERHGKPIYQQNDYIVRNKNYYGYLKGTI